MATYQVNTCSFCVRGKCDGIINETWTELNSIRFKTYDNRGENENNDDENHNRGIIDTFSLDNEQRKYLSRLPFDIVRAIAFHYCDLSDDDINVNLIDKIIFDMNSMYKESAEENEKNTENNIVETRNNSWNHIMKMVTEMNDYKNYNEEIFSREQRIYLSTLPINVVRAIGIIFCNGRKNDDLSVIIRKIYLQLNVIYQTIFEENMIEENITECDNSWDHIINMVSENEYRNYNQQMFSTQYRYLSTLPIDVVIVMGFRYCQGRMNDEISVIIEKIQLKLISVYQEKTQQQNEERWSQQNNIPVREQQIQQLIPPKWIIHPLLICLETANELQEEVFCAICLDSHKKMDILVTNCQHEFCKKCMCDYLDSDYLNNQNDGRNRMPTCSMCRRTITTLETKDVEHYDELYERYTNKPPETIRIHEIFDNENLQEMIDFLDYYGFISEI